MIWRSFTVSDFCFIWILKQDFLVLFLEKVKTDNPIKTSELNMVQGFVAYFSKSSFSDNTVWVWWPRNTWRAYFIYFRKISISWWRACFANCSSGTLFLVSKITDPPAFDLVSVMSIQSRTDSDEALVGVQKLMAERKMWDLVLFSHLVKMKNNLELLVVVQLIFHSMFVFSSCFRLWNIT